MSYANATLTPMQRLRAGAAAIGVPALVGGGLVASLAIVQVVETTIEDPFKAENITVITPEPPPETDPVPDATSQPDSVVTAPTPPVQLPTTNTAPAERPNFDLPDVTVPSVPDIVVDLPGPIGPARPTPSPSPTATFTPAPPVPRNGPQGWITNDDYPRRGITRELEGTTGYRLVVGSNGRVNGCEVTRSSGHGVLDDATCSLLQRRARFDAATGNRGEATVGTYSGSVTWQLPRR